MSVILALQNVCYGYRDGGRRLEVLKSANVSFAEGKLYAIVGPSGSGKTTLLALASALDTPHSGSILFGGRDVREIGLENFRRHNVALVFQSYNLITYMTALENVVTAMDIAGSHQGKRRLAALQLLQQVGLNDSEAKRNVMQLSGGQQQRVAIARALASNAQVILADEPTGNLDPATTDEIVALFRNAAHNYGKCVIVVTHSDDVAGKADLVYKLSDGQLHVTQTGPVATATVVQ